MIFLKRRVGLAKEFKEAVTATTKFWMDYGSYPDNVRKLFNILKDIAAPNIPPSEKTFHILQYYEPILRARYEDHLKGKKISNTFQNITERYKSVDELLTDLALEPPNET